MEKCTENERKFLDLLRGVGEIDEEGDLKLPDWDLMQRSFITKRDFQCVDLSELAL